MGTSDRRPYESATALTQALLDDSQDNLANKLEMIADIETIPQTTGVVTFTIASPCVVTFASATFSELDEVKFITTGSLPSPLIPFKRYFVRNWALNNFNISETSTGPLIDTSGTQSGDHELQGRFEFIRVSDRAKYVGSSYYEPRVQFPEINRTVGEWLAGELEFSSLDIAVNNTDQKYSNLLPSGADFDGFIGKRITVKVGLNEIESSYTTIFEGTITDVAGFGRTTATFNLVCRSDFEKVNVIIPNQSLIVDDFPDIEDEFVGLGAPVIYGDWTTNIRAIAPEIPAFPVNGGNASVLLGTSELRLVISSTPIKTFDDTSVTLFRGDQYYTFDSGDIAVVGGSDNTVFDITQQNLMIDGDPWIYTQGDTFFVKVVGVDIGIYTSNIVAQGRDMLKRFGGLTSANFDATWTTFQNKSSPPESAIDSFTSRVWLQEGTECLAYVLSMLEQVRLETFISRDNLFRMNSLHFDEMVANPTPTIKNWDLNLESFAPTVDARNNFNRAKADYSFNPASGEARLSTPLFRNQVAITQSGRAISKLLSFPNLVLENDVTLNLKEMLKLASAYAEMIETTLTSRAILREIGEFVSVTVSIGSVEFEDVPCMIRDLGYSPDGMSIPVRLWSFQMVPFTGHAPAFNGITGGSTAAITQET